MPTISFSAASTLTISEDNLGYNSTLHTHPIVDLDIAALYCRVTVPVPSRVATLTSSKHRDEGLQLDELALIVNIRSGHSP
jgi:hypothetical protein